MLKNIYLVVGEVDCFFGVDMGDGTLAIIIFILLSMLSFLDFFSGLFKDSFMLAVIVFLLGTISTHFFLNFGTYPI